MSVTKWKKITKDSPPWNGVSVLVWNLKEGMWISSRKKGLAKGGMPMTGQDWYMGEHKCTPLYWRPLPEDPDWKADL